jgi:hypothetical protein
MARRRQRLRVLAEHVVAGSPTSDAAASAGVGVLREAAGSWAEYCADPPLTVTSRQNTPLPKPNSFGVTTSLPGLGILPKKVYTVDAAREALALDGAVVLGGLPTELEGDQAYFDSASALPRQLFGDELLAASTASSVGTVGEEVQSDMRAKWNTSQVQFPPWEPGAPHTDGVKSWGDYCPPYFFLFFSHQCETGGENGLLDTAGLLDYMAEDAELAPTLELLRTVPIDPTPFLDAVRRCYPHNCPLCCVRYTLVLPRLPQLLCFVAGLYGARAGVHRASDTGVQPQCLNADGSIRNRTANALLRSARISFHCCGFHLHTSVNLR